MATRRLELGFDGGTVLRVNVDEPVVATLTSGLADAGDGWHELATEDGTFWIALSQLRYVRVPSEGPRGVGFSES